ncbi:MAG: leucine-rich repeat protein [Eubacterium sp.]|nr:leucine-rich repeat protein [Eubacterium sp.]
MKKIISTIILTAIFLTCAACSNNEIAGNETSSTTSSFIGEQSTADNSITHSSDGSSSEEFDSSSNFESQDNVTSISYDETTVPTVPTDLKPSEGFEFESNGDGTCTLVKIGTCSDKDIVIPEKSPAGDTVTLIGEYALMSLKADSVTLFNYNYKIDERAFQFGKFETLNVIGGNPEIGDSAFSSCEDIETITFQNCNIEIGEYSFMSCGDDAVLKFVDCTGYIDEHAFQFSDFESISFDTCDLELDDNSFAHCENVKLLTISKSTISVGEYTFMNLGKNADIEIVNSDMEFDDRAFPYSSLNSLKISGGTLEMGDSVFSNCEDLTEVTIDCDNISIGEYAFMSCEDLTSVSICDNENSDNNIEIDDRAFQFCKLLTDVKIGSGNVKIGSYVFSNCADNLAITIAGNSYTADSIIKGL